MAYKVDHEIEMELTVNYFTMHSDVQPAILRGFFWGGAHLLDYSGYLSTNIYRKKKMK